MPLYLKSNYIYCVYGLLMGLLATQMNSVTVLESTFGY